MDPLRVVLAMFSCYRLTQLLTIDDGPGDLFFDLRQWAGVYDIGLDEKPKTKVGRILACAYCTGVYVALLVALLVASPTIPGDAFLLWTGIAGAQSFLQGRR